MRAHRAVLDRSPDAERRECAVCGLPVTGADNDLRHLGEERRVEVIPSPSDVPTFTEAERAGHAALQSLSERASDAERSRAVIEALYANGMLRQARKRARANRRREPVLF